MFVLVRALFIAVLAFGVYHLVRDVLQIVGVEHTAVTLFHRDHSFCGGICDVLTIPFDLFIIAGSAYALIKDKFDVVGTLTLCIPVLMLLGSVLLP